MKKKVGIEKRIEQTVEFIGFVFLSIVTSITILQVLLRYIFKTSFIWSEEFTRFLFIWVVWLGAVLGIPKGKHMVIEYLRDRFPKTIALVIKLIMEILAIFFLFVVVFKGWSLAKAMSREYYITFPVSVRYTYLVTVIAGGLMIFYMVMEVRNTLQNLVASGKSNDH